MTSLRIAFMGTPGFAVPCLSELLATGHDICAVYTKAPKAAGRGQDVKPSPVHQFADGFHLEVRTPKSLKSAEEQTAFAALDLDLAIVVAYGLILPKQILEAPKYGCINVHASLLPRWRGAAPIQRAIMAGDDVTGISIMQMDEGLDTGDVLLTDKVSITPETTAGSLHDTLAQLGADLMTRALSALTRDALVPTPQPEEGVTYAHKIDKAEARIDWTKPAHEVSCLIRGLSPFPGAWFELPGEKKPVRIKALNARLSDGSGPPGTVLDEHLTIACGHGAVRLTHVQREGRKAVTAEEFLRGAPVSAGIVVS